MKGDRIMGVTHVEATIRHPAAPERSWQGSFLVDTGAIDSLVPRPYLDAVGLQPVEQRVYQTGDGREVTLDITIARIDLMGELIAGVIIFGDAEAEPLLGVTALESAGVEVDPVNQRLEKLPSVRLTIRTSFHMKTPCRTKRFKVMKSPRCLRTIVCFPAYQEI